MYKCSYGYFDIGNNEFVITDMKPRRFLKNYLWNEKIVAYYDQFGCGLANGKTGDDFRNLTFGEKLVYVKDLQSNEVYCANRNFTDLNFDVHECHVGLGYHRVISEYNGLRCETTSIIPRDDFAEIINYKIVNRTKETKKIAVYSYIKPFVNLTWHIAYSYADFDEKSNGILFKHVGFDIKEKNNHVLIRSNQKVNSFDVSDNTFKGLYNELSNPVGIINDKLSNKALTFNEQYASAMQFVLELQPGEERLINMVSCFGISYEEVVNISNKYISNDSYLSELEYQKKQHYELQEKYVVNCDDTYVNLLINTWLKRQISLGKTWGRVYGKGFRDILQDTSSFVSLDTKTAREKIKLILSYQFENGNAIRQFDPIFDYPYQDGPSWIPATILAYLKETDDCSILKEKVSYYNSDKGDTVFNHMKKGVDYLINNLGQHGLVKWGGGDWNDSIDNAGMQGVGESVWLSIATVKAINEFLEICRHYDINIKEEYYIAEKEKLTKSIIDYGFEEDRYIYGINDKQNRIGSKAEGEVEIFLNPQTWSVLANINSRSVQEKVMNTVEKYLKCDYGYTQSYPAYSSGDESIGRLSFFTPGTYENGSVYNHGVAFKMYADLILGKEDLAYETFKMISPLNPNNINNGMEVYAIANMYFGPSCPTDAGYAPSSWITGTAGWIYRAFTEMMFGIKANYDSLLLEPKLPSSMNKIEVKRVYQGTTYNITIEKTGTEKLIVDNICMNGNKVYPNDNKNVSVYYSY